MLYIPLTVLLHVISILDIEYTNEAVIYSLLKALLVWLHMKPPSPDELKQ